MLDAKNLHHAYVIEGDIRSSLAKVRKFLVQDLQVTIKGNIDFFERMYPAFGIDDAREIKEFMIDKALSQYKIFLLGIPSMTTQSGNALLKALEEPPVGTHFFILVPNSKRLLSTLLSRVVLLKWGDTDLSAQAGEKENLLGITPEEFLTLKKEMRLDEVKNILSLYDKEKIVKQDIISFLTEVLQAYRIKKNHDHEALKNAVTAFDYTGDQSASLKLIMEYISLVLV